MRLPAALLMGLLVSNAYASPVKPNQDRVDEIQEVLVARKLSAEKAARAEALRNKIENQIGLRDEQDQPLPLNQRVEEYAKRLLGLGNKVYEDYARLTADYKRAQEELQKLSAKAIELARAAYQTSPAKSSGVIVSGPPLPTSEDDVPGFIGNQAAYIPKYSGQMSKGTSGTTDDAGKVLIGPDAFDSPGKLAFTLYHEGEHFEKLLTPGLDLRNLPDEEVLAREKQRPLLKGTFDFSDKAIEDFDKVLAAERIRAEKWRQYIAQGLDPYKLSHQPAFPRSNAPMRLEDSVYEEVDRILARTKELRDQERKGRFGFLDDVKEESIRARQQVQAQDDDYTAWYRRFDAILTRAEETRRQEKAEREYNRELGRHASEFGYLSAAAGMSCSDPDGFVAEVRKGRYTSVSMDRAYLADYLTMAAGGLSPCQMELLAKIKNSDRSVSWSDLLAWGRQYRDAHPTLGRRVGRALQAFRDSFDVFGSDGTPEPRGSSEERSRPPRSESPKVDCFIDASGTRACCVANCD